MLIKLVSSENPHAKMINATFTFQAASWALFAIANVASQVFSGDQVSTASLKAVVFIVVIATANNFVNRVSKNILNVPDDPRVLGR